MKRNSKIIKVVTASVLALTVITSAIGIGSVVMYSDAKYTSGNEESYSAKLYDFDVQFSLEYQSGGVTKTLSAEDLKTAHGIVRLTVDEYNTLKLNTSYTGGGKCYYRFKITESWQHEYEASNVEMITPKSLSEYTLDESLYDNRSDDGYIYCKEALQDDDKSFVAISKCTAGIDAKDLIDKVNDKSTFVDISVELEAVQWNRAEELWGLSKLPWE